MQYQWGHVYSKLKKQVQALNEKKRKKKRKKKKKNMEEQDTKRMCCSTTHFYTFLHVPLAVIRGDST